MNMPVVLKADVAQNIETEVRQIVNNLALADRTWGRQCVLRRHQGSPFVEPFKNRRTASTPKMARSEQKSLKVLSSCLTYDGRPFGSGG